MPEKMQGWARMNYYLLTETEACIPMVLQSAKLTTGPMPEASRFDAGPVSLPCPLALLASENPTLQKVEKQKSKICHCAYSVRN